MRIPKINNSILNQNNTDIYTTMEIDPDTLEQVELDLEIDPENPKTFPRFIKGVKSVIRTSPAYKNLVEFMKENYDMNKSFFFKGVKNSKEQKNVYSIELHHTPFVLEDIVVTVIRKRMTNGESLKVLDIAKEVMYLHYIGVIGLAPLDKTTHSLIHSENSPEVFIPLQYIPFGECHDFFNDYRDYIPDNVKVSYLYLQDLSLKYEKISDSYPSYLKPKYLYYKGFMDVSEFGKLVEDLQNKRVIRDDE